MKRFLALAALAATLMAAAVSCGKEDVLQQKTSSPVVTGAATHVSCRNATISGRLISPQTLSFDLSYGVIYSPSNGMQTEDVIRIEAKSLDSDNMFSVTTNILEPDTTYYYRCFMSQSGEITYGEVKSFKTLALSSMIQTLDATDINPKDAVLNAFLDLTDCKYDALEYGFEVTPEGGSLYSKKSNNHTEAKFSVKDETLSSDTKYSVAAYVKLDGYTYSGDLKTFRTSEIRASITAESSEVNYKNATISGRLTVESEGTFSKSATLYYSRTANTLESLKSRGDKTVLTLSSDGTYSFKFSTLSSLTRYYYIVIAKVGDMEIPSSIKSFTTLDYPTPDLVDLDLSVKWASCNLGAYSPGEQGGYYQWAGTTDVSSDVYVIDLSNCPYNNGTSHTVVFTKYNNHSDYGKVDNKTTLDLTDDAARVNLGGSWRIPTEAEWAELQDTYNCTWTWTALDGKNGYLVTSKKNGNSIFLPAAGYRHYEYLYDAGSSGYYWSSSLCYDSWRAHYLYFYSGGVGGAGRTTGLRYFGQSVRPVFGTGVSLRPSTVTLTTGSSLTLTATVSPPNVTDKSVKWSSSNTGVATVSSSGVVVAVSVGSAVITVKANDGGKTATCTVTVTGGSPTPSGTVDLGLSVKWASCNLGASSPEEHGGYYQWAGTTDVPTGKFLSWGNCPYNNGSKVCFTKYNTKSDCGKIDNETTLDLTDDAARVKLGGSWRIPTEAEWAELQDTYNCTWTWTALNGKDGYLVTSKKNGNSIFLPATGYRYEYYLSKAGSDGYYWSSSLLTDSPYCAYGLNFNTDNVRMSSYYRYYGLSVRPVSE